MSDRGTLVGLIITGAVLGGVTGWWVGGRERQMEENSHRIVAATAGSVIGVLLARFVLPKTLP